MALVLTLMVLVLITAMATEFAYGVFTGTNSLYNWSDSQRLSVFANSGVNIAKEFIAENIAGENYTYPGSFDMDFDSQSKGDARLSLRIEDENAKFNINTIVYPNGMLNEAAYNSFKRLLSDLSIDTKTADYIADWIDPDSEDRIRDSEKGAKNGPLYSVNELLLIAGIDKTAYEKLLPHVTIYGDGRININSAGKPVLKSLSPDMTDELAQRIIDYRKNTPFERTTDLLKVAGFNLKIYNPISARITVKGQYFYVRASAASKGIKSIIEAVVGTNKEIRYWREF